MKDAASIGGKHYPMIVKDDFTRRGWLYFLRNKSDAASAFRSFLASVRADRLPSLVEIVRSDNGGEFSVGNLNPCAMNFRSNKSSPRLTAPNSMVLLSEA